MSGLARILHAWGYDVSGSDSAPSPLLDELARRGNDGQRRAHRHRASRGCRSGGRHGRGARRQSGDRCRAWPLAGRSSSGRDCWARWRTRGGAWRSRAATANRRPAACWSMRFARAWAPTPRLPSARCWRPAGATNAAPGSGAEMVVEADEYDWSFLQLHPDVAIITNIDYDHPDLFPDAETYDRAFADFVRGMRRDGTLVIAGDDPGCAALARPLRLSPARERSSPSASPTERRLAAGARRKRGGASPAETTSPCRWSLAVPGTT